LRFSQGNCAGGKDSRHDTTPGGGPHSPLFPFTLTDARSKTLEIYLTHTLLKHLASTLIIITIFDITLLISDYPTLLSHTISNKK